MFLRLCNPAFMGRDEDEKKFRDMLVDPAYADRSYFLEFLKE